MESGDGVGAEDTVPAVNRINVELSIVDAAAKDFLIRIHGNDAASVFDEICELTRGIGGAARELRVLPQGKIQEQAGAKRFGA